MHAASPSTITTGVAWVDQLILWTLVVSILGGAAWKVIRWAIPFFRRADEVFATILGSVREGRRSLDDRLDAIEHELFPNSGGSLRDAIDRTERHGARTEEKIDDHIEQSALILKRGRESEQEIRRDLIEQREASREREAQIWDVLKHVSEALPIVAQSAPPHEDHNDHEEHP